MTKAQLTGDPSLLVARNPKRRPSEGDGGFSPKTHHGVPAIRTFWAQGHREHTCPDPPPGGARRVRGVPAAWTSACLPLALVQTHFLRISCPLPGPPSQGPLLVTDPQGVQILSPSPFLPASHCSGAVIASTTNTKGAWQVSAGPSSLLAHVPAAHHPVRSCMEKSPEVPPRVQCGPSACLPTPQS